MRLSVLKLKKLLAYLLTTTSAAVNRTILQRLHAMMRSYSGC